MASGQGGFFHFVHWLSVLGKLVHHSNGPRHSDIRRSTDSNDSGTSAPIDSGRVARDSGNVLYGVSQEGQEASGRYDDPESCPGQSSDPIDWATEKQSGGPPVRRKQIPGGLRQRKK